jgi:hypothetical protein
MTRDVQDQDRDQTNFTETRTGTGTKKAWSSTSLFMTQEQRDEMITELEKGKVVPVLGPGPNFFF